MPNNDKPIGVFDSGLGGITVLSELYTLMPNENYIYIGDNKNAPYGTKSEDEVFDHTEENIKNLLKNECKAIVIACNTATSIAAERLRKRYSVPIIGIEPAIKPAVVYHPSSVVIVMATPLTLKKEKFLNLMNNYSSISRIIPLPCPGLVELIEKGITDGEQIDMYLKKMFSPLANENISTVVLGCTHYPFIKKSIEKYFGFKADIIDGGAGTAKETRRRLAEIDSLNKNKHPGNIDFRSSLDLKTEIDLMKKMFERLKKQ